MSGFYQRPPVLANQYNDDRAFKSLLRRALPGPLRDAHEAELARMGALAGDELYRMQLEDRLREPTLTQWDPWGHRIDRIDVTPLWHRAASLAAEYGLVATGYDRTLGAHARTLQFAKVYLFAPSSDLYTCPLAMTDGAARTLAVHRDEHNDAVVQRASARLLSRTPGVMWTSGQWMTERTGGSDVGRTETVAVHAPEAGDRAFRLYGTKWFSSATTSEMALTLARPQGNEPGSRGLALYYLETRDAQGALNHIKVNRLKDKLGTRKVPTAELSLEGTAAFALKGTRDGVKSIAPMLTITRTWNAVCAVAGMRRAIALARSYAHEREAFGALLRDKPLHRQTLATLQAESEAALHLVFRTTELMGLDETAQIDDEGRELLRLLVPLCKLSTGKQAVRVASETLECFGGAGYVEDTGLPTLLRDAQVLPIWEGTTNVLSLDVLRVFARGLGPLDALEREVARALDAATKHGRLAFSCTALREALPAVRGWLQRALAEGPHALEAGARHLALSLGRTAALAALVTHAAWSLEHEDDARSAAAASLFAREGIVSLSSMAVDAEALEDARALALDEAVGAESLS